MAVVDSYSVDNYSSCVYYAYASYPHNGQCIQLGSTSSYKLTSVDFYIYKTGSPTGNVYSAIYHATGTAPNMEPTGNLLATSDAKPAADVPTSPELVEFTFSGNDQITLDANGKYYIACYYDGGNSSNRINVGVDDTSPTHPGNFYQDFTGADSGVDSIFYLHGIPEGVELIDSYPRSNRNYYYYTYGPNDLYVGQCIDMGSTNYKLTSVEFCLTRDGSPTGNCYSAVYAAEGTAPNMYRVGSRLAKSDERPVTDITTLDFETIEFTFTGDNQIVLDANGKYEIEFYYGGGNDNNLIGTGVDTSSPTHPGNEYDCYSGTNSGVDCIFYLYGTPVIPKTVPDTGSSSDEIKAYSPKTISDSGLSSEKIKVYFPLTTKNATDITYDSAKLHGEASLAYSQAGFDYTDEQGNWKWSTV